MFKKLAFVLALSFSPLVLADSPISVDEGSFVAQRAAIEKSLADGKTYAEMSSADRSKVRDGLDRMAAMLEGGKTPQSLPADRKVDLYNTQESVNILLTQAASDSRMVCTREVATGSHRKVTTCATAAERARRRQQDQDALGKSQRTQLPVKD